MRIHPSALALLASLLLALPAAISLSDNTAAQLAITGVSLIVVIGAVIYGLGEGLSLATLQDLVAGAAPDETRGAVVAVWVAAVRAGQAVGPLIAAAGLATVGASTSFVLAALAPLVLFGLLMASPMRTGAADA